MDKLKRVGAAVIGLGGSASGLALMWQAVRFCMGEVGAPVVDQVIAILNRGVPGWQVGPLGPGWIVFDWVRQLYYYVFGIVAWVILGAMVSIVSQAVSRIVLVGFKQFWAEEMAAREEDARRAKIEAARERRRELRRKFTEPKSSVGTAILIGTLFGLFMLFLSR